MPQVSFIIFHNSGLFQPPPLPSVKFFLVIAVRSACPSILSFVHVFLANFLSLSFSLPFKLTPLFPYFYLLHPYFLLSPPFFLFLFSFSSPPPPIINFVFTLIVGMCTLLGLQVLAVSVTGMKILHDYRRG